MDRIQFIAALVAFALLVTIPLVTLAEVPGKISYQGRLTDNAGQPVVDDTYSVQFSIYTDSVISILPALWTETQMVTTSSGLFEVLLGSFNPINPDIFNGSVRYLGIAVSGNPESMPRTPIVSTPYAMAAGTVLDQASIGCHDCDTVFINATGPDELIATGDTALTVTNIGPDAHLGIQARVETSSAESAAAVRGIINSSSANGSSYGAAFDAISTGIGTTEGVKAIGENNSPVYSALGVHAIGRNNGGGAAGGGLFEASDNGSGTHWGVYGTAFGAAGADCIGMKGQGENTSVGPAYGGYFSGYGASGEAYGTYNYARANGSSAVVGVYGNADQQGGGKSIGGWFSTTASGSFQHIGVLSETYGSTSLSNLGVYGRAANSGSGKSYGGYFFAPDSGDGNHYGVLGSAYGSTSDVFGTAGSAVCTGTTSAMGAYGYASNYGSGPANGGYFEGWANGTGRARGIYSCGFGIGEAESMYGIEATTQADYYFEGPGYGGYFKGAGVAPNVGNQYGVYGLAETFSGNSCFGVYGRGNQHVDGNVYGGYFITDSSGTGTSYGIRPVGLSKGSSSAYGTASVAANRSDGVVYGGYFEMLNYGTGYGYGVYGKARTTGAPCWAGYFEGHVRITNVLDVLGTKSAAVKVDNGDYRRLYCQESTEIWFEDFGEGQLSEGHAHIELDPMFLQTVTIDAANPIKVFVQLNDPECNGVAVVRDITSFDVVELLKGTSDASFSYRVIAKRRGYEDYRMELMTGPSPEEVSARTELDQQRLAEDELSAEEDYLSKKNEEPVGNPEKSEE